MCVHYSRVFDTVFLQPGFIQTGSTILLVRIHLQVLDWIAGGRKTKMCTGRSPWANLSVRRSMYKDWMTRVYVDMGDIVNLDTVKKVRTLRKIVLGSLISINFSLHLHRLLRWNL